MIYMYVHIYCRLMSNVIYIVTKALRKKKATLDLSYSLRITSTWICTATSIQDVDAER